MTYNEMIYPVRHETAGDVYEVAIFVMFQL